eukprot:3936205-Rhodomonas_salina.1
MSGQQTPVQPTPYVVHKVLAPPPAVLGNQEEAAEERKEEDSVLNPGGGTKWLEHLEVYDHTGSADTTNVQS